MGLILWKEHYRDSDNKNVFRSSSCTPGVSAEQHGPAFSPHSGRTGSFHPVNKQQPDIWQAASLDVWWNKCILICAETWLRKADLQPNSTSELWGGIFFFSSSVFFFSFPWQAHFSSLSRTAAGGGIITLHYITEHSIMGLNPTAFTLVAVSITDRALLCKVLKAHKFCMFNKSTFCVWCLTVCCQYFQSTIPGRELYVHKMLKSHDCHQLSENSFISLLVSSAHPGIHSRWSGHGSLNALKITYYVRRNKVFSLFLPRPLSPISPSWQWRLMQRHLPPGRTLSLHYRNKALFSCHIFTSLWVELHVCIPECVCVCMSA